ncbi:hypothetical protein BS78_10G064000 [Paspalum vaginatum]|nr:hypothetical protein BS78_10G064000 [Paspalum vaginatum]
MLAVDSNASAHSSCSSVDPAALPPYAAVGRRSNVPAANPTCAHPFRWIFLCENTTQPELPRASSSSNQEASGGSQCPWLGSESVGDLFSA